MPHRVKTPFLSAHLDAPEISEASNVTDVLLWLDQNLDTWAWAPRGVRKGAKPPPDVECRDLVFVTAPEAASFKLHWAGRMWGDERRM